MSKMSLLYSFNFTAEGCYDIFEGFEEYNDNFIRFNELWYLKKCKMSVNSLLQVNFCKDTILTYTVQNVTSKNV